VSKIETDRIKQEMKQKEIFEKFEKAKHFSVYEEMVVNYDFLENLNQ